MRALLPLLPMMLAGPGLEPAADVSVPLHALPPNRQGRPVA